MLDYPLGLARTPARVISVGLVKIGGTEPIVLQSMLTSSAQELDKAMEEIRQLDQAGAQLIRLSIPTKKELDAIGPLRLRMAEEGIKRPLVADVHFSPALAVLSVPWFEKVRINPGNFSDSPKKTSQSSFDVDSFEAGRDLFRQALEPFAKAVLEFGRAVRVGVNQGSLSQRMMAQYGDSPLGMVESALEAVDLLEAFGVRDIVISLKSSNPLVVLKAYRLLAQKRQPKEPLPLHLGVTEAGDGLMGRIKSLSGIGPLLFDGLGDTVRVSLTEPSSHEIAYGHQLVEALKDRFAVPGKPSPNWQRPLQHRQANEYCDVFDGQELGGQSPIKLFGFGDSLIQTDLVLTSGEGGYTGPAGTTLPIVDTLEELQTSGPIVCRLLDPVIELRRFFETAIRPVISVGILVEPDWFEATLGKVELSCLLTEGLADFLVLPALPEAETESLKLLLQATRIRIYVTDYIACPSCARTLFDLEKTTEKIRNKTNHLKGLKIGIMGCIVNGPGEMADADFGYIGSGMGKIDLYRGQEQVTRNIPESEAVEALIQLIKESGRWIDP